MLSAFLTEPLYKGQLIQKFLHKIRKSVMDGDGVLLEAGVYYERQQRQLQQEQRQKEEQQRQLRR